ARVELKRIDDQRGVDVEEIGRRGDPAEQPGDGRLTSIAENVTASRKADETFTGLDSDVRRDQRGCRCPARSRRASSDHLVAVEAPVGDARRLARGVVLNQVRRRRDSADAAADLARVVWLGGLGEVTERGR